MKEELSDERTARLVGELFVLPSSQRTVPMDRDEVLSLIREVKRARAGHNPWDRLRAQESLDLSAKGFRP